MRLMGLDVRMRRAVSRKFWGKDEYEGVGLM